MALLSFFFSYILGSFNFAIFISKKFYKKNIKQLGSKNAGMTNVLRNFGFLPAIITFIGDVLKGFISLLVCYILCFKFLKPEALVYVQYMACISALLGHIFPIFYKFKGGKGISVVAGAVLFMDFKIFLAAVSVFIIVFKFSKMVSLSSLSGALLYPVIVFFISFFKNISTFQLINSTVFATVISIILIFAHKENIKRIIEKKEPKIKRLRFK